MTMFTLLEINGDHINEEFAPDLPNELTERAWTKRALDDPDRVLLLKAAAEVRRLHDASLWKVLSAVVRNPSNAYLLEQHGLNKAIRIVRQSGNPVPFTITVPTKG